MKKLLIGLTLLASIPSFATDSSEHIVSINQEALKESKTCVYTDPSHTLDSSLYCGGTEALRLTQRGFALTGRESVRRKNLKRAILMEIMYQNNFEMLISPSFDGNIGRLNSITFIKK